MPLKVAIEYGPIVYCAEFADNNGHTSNLIVPEKQQFQTSFKPDLLNGVMILKGTANAINILDDFSVNTTTQTLILIPYYTTDREKFGCGFLLKSRIWRY